MKRELVLRILDRSHELTSSARMEGAAVFNKSGDRLGAIHSVMLNKRTGRAAYVVMLLDGQDGHAHPLPWGMLHYDEGKTGYVVDLSPEVIAQAPSFALDDHDRPTVPEAAMRQFYEPRMASGADAHTL